MMDTRGVTPNYSDTKRKAEGGYYCYLPNPEQHTNAASSHVGWGETQREAAEAALYWANQAPWAVVRPASKTPAWDKEAWNEHFRQSLD